MPRKGRKTKGQKPYVPKTSRRAIPSETRAAVTALASQNVSYQNIEKETGVKIPTAHGIVTHAEKLAATNH
jgi:DNA invertase Pin-like site-specific DNA recombinase